MMDRPMSLASLGWSDFFGDQLDPQETGLAPSRVAMVHRSRLATISQTGHAELSLPAHTNIADFAVGDWVIADPQTHLLYRRLARKTLVDRFVEGAKTPQLVAANIDTLFIVTSCNADFSSARLERYLVVANQARTTPVILLTKADTVANAGSYEQQASALQRGLAVVSLNARSRDAVAALAPWCGSGQTVALIGSSGVGKSTLVNSLAGEEQVSQQTGSVREHDAKGRHTTTARSLHAIAGGGWIIDTPGMRTLHVSDHGPGIDMLFAEISELAPLCRFRDCTHAHEPGCAVQAAVTSGTLDVERLTRWRTLQKESQNNTPEPTWPRGRSLSHRKKR